MITAKNLILSRLIKPDIDITNLSAEDIALLKIIDKATGGGVVPIYDADITNGIASFNGVTKSKPLVSLKLNIPVTQTGSGTPSPDNIRDFVGVSQAVIGQTSGYGEYFQGLLNGTYGFVDLGSLTWKLTSDSIIFYTTSDPFGSGSAKYLGEGICPNYERGYVPVQNPESGKWQIANSGDLTVLRIADSNYNDPVAFKTAMQGVYLIYEKKDQTTPTITEQQFNTLCQAFGITGNIFTISFGQTVYSAILDVLTGKLYLTHEIKTIDENSGVVVSSTNNNVYICDDVFNIDEDTESINCNVYQRGENRQSISGVVNNNPDLSFCCKLGTNPTRLLIKDTRFTSTEDYNTWLANNPVKIAVKLAEPIEIQLTPTIINTLIGDNVIFADVGDITECKYTRK